jgi:putative transposase
VTLRSINKVQFPVNMAHFWSYISDLLYFCTHAFSIEIHAFVLMSNHYHMLVSTPKGNLDKFMFYFNKELSREIQMQSGVINQKFGARYFSSIICSQRYYETVYRYIYRNPVDAGLSQRVEAYKYSSLRFIINGERYLFPIFDTHFEQIENYWSVLNWLNTSYNEGERMTITKSLKSEYFGL